MKKKIKLSLIFILFVWLSHCTYADDMTYEVHDGIPAFSADELIVSDLIQFDDLDELGRCVQAIACIGPETMAVEERESIGDIKPSGWHQNKYEGLVDSTPPYLYNRCHLIGYQLLGNVSNDERNLITGTRSFNIDAMLPYENKIADYVNDTGNHVLYRVTPEYDGDNLLSNGVLMEAESIEDEGLIFSVFAKNVQPGVYIDYATGENWIDDSCVTAKIPDEQDPGNERQYVLNTNTKKFHYPECASVKQIKDKNRKDYWGDREQLLDEGYSPCGNCRP